MQQQLAFFRFGLGPSATGSGARAATPEAVVAQLYRPAPPTAGEMPGAAAALAMFMERAQATAAARRDNTRPGRNPAFELAGRELDWRLAQAQSSPAPLLERLAIYWTNHFTVTQANAAALFVGPFEREAIRPHLLGRFEAMLRACTIHPGMLFYLGNRLSIGPNSAEGQRRQRGLNENLARELLELHTLGVDGGYTQTDVQEVARILTGWTVALAPGPASYQERIAFNPALHEPGDRTVLGTRIAEGGAEQLDTLLRLLVRHPATARFVGRRLARHFVGETAPEALATALAARFRETEGDLMEVTRTLVTHPASWQTPPRKLRQPQELLFSAARMAGATPPRPTTRGALAALGQPWQRAASPAGWPEEDNAWASADSVKTRLDWAIEFAANLDSRQDARAMAEAAFGDALSPQTRQALQRAANGQQAMTLLLMSPEFQRR